VHEFTQTVYTVADDAYLNIAFDPSLVKDYRLIGFDNKLKALTDSLNEVQGGEVGSGYSLLALFEIIPEEEDNGGPASDKNKLARVILNYKLPGDSLQRISTYECGSQPVLFRELKPSYRFASSVALFGGLLKKSRLMGQAGWRDAIELAEKSRDPEDGIQKELVTLIEKARKIYGKQKHKRKGE
jgi:Ca-activated chloride channel family protein